MINLLADKLFTLRKTIRSGRQNGSATGAPKPSEQRNDIHGDGQSGESSERVVRNPYRSRNELTPAASMIVKAIVDTLKIQVRETGVENIRIKAKGFLTKLRLLDECEKFLLPEFETIWEKILPPELNIEEVDKLINRMASAVTENEFALGFLEKVGQQEDWPEIKKRVAEYGPEELSTFIAYAVVLQNLTEVMFKDINLLSASLVYWLKIMDKNDLTKSMSVPLRIKYESIMYPAKKYSEFVTKGECPRNFAKYLLPVNIMEAVALDLFRGNLDNAATGFELAKHTTGVEPNPRTGAGFTTVAHRSIATGQDLVETWNDLYQVWNAYFVATFGTTYLVKLLIPQVSEYRHDAKQSVYAYNRVIALIVNLFMMVFDGVDVADDTSGKTESVFVNKILFEQRELFELWGKTNRESARVYRQDVKEANQST